jgi:glucose/arabinose dehydrogenase
MNNKRTAGLALIAALAGSWAAAQQAGPPRLAAPTLPPGFTVTLFADGLPTPRHIAVRDNGDVYVTLRSGQAKFRTTDEPGGIQALRDTDGDGRADVSVRFGSDDIDTGIAIHGGDLYFSSMTTIYAVALGDELVPQTAPEIVVANLPESCCGHRTKPITFDGAGHLYTQVGSPSNACQVEPDKPGSPGMMPCTLLDEHGGVFRFGAEARNQDHARDGHRVSRGHRNVVALEWNGAAGALYGLMHGRDGLHQLWPEHFSAADDIELPAEEFHRFDEGVDLGWPYTYYDPRRHQRMVSPEYGGDGKTPAEPGRYDEPLIAFPGHWAPDDLVFYTGNAFPARYRNGAFIAFHGAVVPRRPDVGGYSVVFVPMNAAGDVAGQWEIFADDFESVLTAAGTAGRPAGLAVGPDGALYIGDDTGGRIWKVGYDGAARRYGSLSRMPFTSSAVKARRVSVRMLPATPTPKANAVADASSAASMIATRSYRPVVQ